MPPCFHWSVLVFVHGRLVVILMAMMVLVLVVMLVVVATLPMAMWPLQFSVKERRGGEHDDPPAYVDGDNGKHCHCLDDMARCHVITCMLHCLLLCLVSAVVIVGGL